MTVGQQLPPGDAGAAHGIAGVASPTPYLNRELSQLDFISRVIAVAEDPGLPLLERLKFLAISGQNLDHFFQVRVSGLKTQVESQVDARSPDGLGPVQQLEALRPRVLELTQRQGDLFAKDLLPKLAQAGIIVHAWDEIDRSARERLSQIFDDQIFAVLTPLTVDPAHPFPYISNLSLNLALVVRDHDTGLHRFARVKVPPLLPRFLSCGVPGHFVPVEEVIAAHAGVLFPGTDILSCHSFRVTRDADLAIEESDADDLLLAVASGLQRRLRTNVAVRLEAPAAMSDPVRTLLTAELELDPNDVYCTNAPLDLGALWSLYGLDRPELKHTAFLPVTPLELRDGEDAARCDFFARLRERDLLVHHPYESFTASVEAFLAQAAADPAVLAIKHTLYRTSRQKNSIVSSLIHAASSGKEVVTLVELTARFDEEANIEWARRLEEAGVHVVYGMVGLKAHGKTTLVVRREGEAIRRYGHIGTGNYNPETARAYEDLGLFTADPALCADLGEFFNYLTAYSKQSFRKLWVAPGKLRSKLLELIRREADAPDGRIVIKCNALADPELVDALYAASRAGAEIDLIVRGVCCLRPGVAGLSENIRVRSIIGRFLEHSRVFRFGSDARGPIYAIGSADLMARNLDRRVEVVTPVEHPGLAARLGQVLETLLADDVLAWQLDANGAWHRVASGRGVNAQQTLLESAARRAEPRSASL